MPGICQSQSSVWGHFESFFDLLIMDYRQGNSLSGSGFNHTVFPEFIPVPETCINQYRCLQFSGIGKHYLV
jgi:hypothetical protein